MVSNLDSIRVVHVLFFFGGGPLLKGFLGIIFYFSRLLKQILE